MPLRVCPVEGCGRAMRTSVTVLVVSRDGAEYKRVCQDCGRKAQRILPAAVAKCCYSCGEKEPRLCGACVERTAQAHMASVGKAIASRIRAAAKMVRARGPDHDGHLRAERADGMDQAADMAEAAGSLPAEGKETDGAESKPPRG